MIPPSFWKVCDFVLQLQFKSAHVPGRMNTEADFLSRLDINPKDKVLLRIREDIQTTPIQVKIQSSDIHEEKKTSSTSYQKMTPKLRRTSGNENKEPERTYISLRRTNRPSERLPRYKLPNGESTIGMQQHTGPR